MQSGTGNLIDNPYMSNVQYRGGSDGNPDNSISFKALYGSFADNRKFEPSSANRLVRLLDPSRAYFWKWTWGSEVRLLVQEGIGGGTVYNYSVPTAGTYARRRRTTRTSAQTPRVPWRKARVPAQ